ncbi:unnamed protein product [Vicia faba]|uniref:Uncharacterized protein n=1 Tax=Vicia faba TaxID=3906 RepID=A0AAV1AG58_VICFA|nr:unnamed protein product [Vicia faba]
MAVNIEFANFSDVREGFDNIDAIVDRDKMDPKTQWLVYGARAPLLQKVALKLLPQPSDIDVPLCQLNLSHKMYVPDISLHNIPHVNKYDLATDGNMIVVPLMYGPMRNHLSQKYFGEETQESNMENQNIDKYVPNILSDMLEREYQIHKENDGEINENNFVSDDVHEDVEGDTRVTHVGVVNNHDEKRNFASKGKQDHIVEDVEKNIETLCEDVLLLTNQETLCYLLKKMEVFMMLKLLIILPILEPSD